MLNVAGNRTIPVKIGMNNHTRLTKNPNGSALRTASSNVAAYNTSSAGIVCRNEPTTNNPNRGRNLYRASTRCNRPALAEVSSLNTTWWSTSSTGGQSLFDVGALAAFPMHPHGHNATSRLSNQSGAVVVTHRP